MTREQMEQLFDVAGAKIELATKRKEQIERETAYKWAGRAVAAYRVFVAALNAKEPGEEMKALAVRDQAVEYAHEAREHAAGVGDDGVTLRLVSEAIDDELMRMGLA